MNKIKHTFFNHKNEDKRTLQFFKMQNQAPSIALSDLSEREQVVYASWWRDLDLFDLGQISNEKILNFLEKCCLEDNKLEKILVLFETARNGLNKTQFFAMLRLIAHAQNGRSVSRALIYLGAPIPTLQPNIVQHEQKHIDTIFTKSTNDNINKWWDQPLTTTATLYNQQGNWYENQQQQFIENNSRTRSRSATTPTSIQQDNLPSSFSLFNLKEEDHGQSLLLTKAFVYQSPSQRNKELSYNGAELSNPFHSPSDDSDDDDSDELDSPFADHTNNSKPNSYMIPPPPVPSQSTKPAFLKYTRNNYFLQRSQSTKENQTKKQVYHHQRHKSISSSSYYYVK